MITWTNTWSWTVLLFLCRLRSIATHRDHFVRRLSHFSVILSKAMLRRRHMHSSECCHYFLTLNLPVVISKEYSWSIVTKLFRVFYMQYVYWEMQKDFLNKSVAWHIEYLMWFMSTVSWKFVCEDKWPIDSLLADHLRVIQFVIFVEKFNSLNFIDIFVVSNQGWGRLLWKVIDYDYNYMAFKK